MRGFVLLFRHELKQRVFLLAASLAMGVFVLLVPYLPGSRAAATELRGAAGLITALSWCAVLAILLGGSIFTRDLTENRLAFDFRLPVRPSAIWAARLLAAIVTIALAAALLLAPPAAAGMDWTGAAAGLDEWIGHGAHGALAYSPLAILALLLLAHPIALAGRTHSAWSGVDMVSVAILSLAAYWSWDALRVWDAQGAIWQSVRVLASAGFLGTLIASLLQLARGGTELDKAQRALSLGLLTTAIVGATAVLGIAHWTLRPQLEDLIGDVSNAQSLGPDWVALQGPTRRARSIRSRFLLAPASGRTLRLGPLPGDPGDRKSIATSIDDSTIAWLESDSESRSLRFFRLSTGAKAPAPQSTPTSTTDLCVNWVLSPDGAFVAALEMLGKETDPMRLVVSRLATGDVVASLQFPHCRIFGDMLFASSQEILVPCGFPPISDLVTEVTRVVRVDLMSKTTLDERYYPSFPNALDASLGLVRTPHGWLRSEIARTEPVQPYGPHRDYGRQTAWRLRSYESNRLVADLTPPELVPAHAWVRGIELRDGNIAMAFSGPQGGLATYAASGQRLLAIAGLGGMPPASPFGGLSTILAESRDSGTVLVGSYGRSYKGAALFQFQVVDLRNGAIRPLEEGLRPAAGWLGEIGSTHSVLNDSSGRFLWFNPETKTLQPLLSSEQYSPSGLPRHHLN